MIVKLCDMLNHVILKISYITTHCLKLLLDMPY